MRDFVHFLIRVSAFWRKEIVEIMRQPRLVLTLVLGPFLILLLFGVGFRNEARSLRTLFVAPEGSELARQIESYAASLGDQLIFAGMTGNEGEALTRLSRGEVDVVAAIPADAYQKIRNSEQAVIPLYHNEIDPFQVEYVNVFGRVYVDEVNRRLLRTFAEEGQSEASTIREDLQAARTSASALRQALEQGNQAEARQQQRELNQNVGAVALAAGASLGLLNNVQQTFGPGGGSDDTAAILNSLDNLQQNTEALDEPGGSEPGANDANVQKVAEIEEDLTLLESRLEEFQNINSDVLVSPFRSEARSITRLSLQLVDYFAPSVIVLLLQHLALTFGALSIVREHSLGTTELFRVSPLSAFETLLGKYISYFLFGGILATILTLLQVFGLGIPMLGTWLNYTLVIAALLFTSLGVGFVISLVSQTDSQAVQYSMIVLLASVFFSGFFLSLESLWEPVRIVSWMLPATYAILLLKDIMLRGYLANPVLLGSLTGIGLGLFLLSLVLMRRLLARR